MAIHILSDEARKTAQLLLDIKAVLFNVEKPFILTSGRAAPVYIDCRRVISYPKARKPIVDMLGKKVVASAGQNAFDLVAGAETVGIAYAAWMSDYLNLPMVYVRKQPKGHGAGSQIEGNMQSGQRVLLMEDIVNYGGSVEKFVTALRNAGAQVDHVCALFHYNILAAVDEKFKALNITLHYLCTWADMLAYMKEVNYLPADQHEQVVSFLADPIPWSRAHGGKEEDPSKVA